MIMVMLSLILIEFMLWMNWTPVYQVQLCHFSYHWNLDQTTTPQLFGVESMVYFSNSGAEVNEGALKLAKKVTKRPAIISFKRGFHGRTLATTSITSSSSIYRKDYEGLLPSVYYAEFPYAYRSGLSEEEEVERCLACALILSP